MAETLLVAGAQTAGRGRGRRDWVSPEGNLYATWLGWVEVGALRAVPICAAVALAEACEDEIAALQVQFKWPNDLLVGGRKLGGVLAQGRVSGGEAAVVVGFGVNLAVTPPLPSGGVGPTSAAEWGWRGDPVSAALNIAVGCVGRLRRYLGQPAVAYQAWAARTVHKPGDDLRVRAGEEVVCGRFVGFGPVGELLLEVAGQQRVFYAADLVGEL